MNDSSSIFSPERWCGAYMTGVSTSSRATIPGLFVGLGPLARDYILDTDGTGDFRMRAVRSYRENGQFY